MVSEPISRLQGGADPASSPLDDRDRALLANVPRSLANGLRCLDWWRAAGAAGAMTRKFPLVRTFNPDDEAFGFFGEVPFPAGPLPVMGVSQQMFFDVPKSARPEVFRDQLREFVLHYFLRVADFRRPTAYVPTDRTEAQTPLPLLSWCPTESDPREGFGYSQLYYKLSGSGQVGKFPAVDRARIVDLREIGPVYEWIVVSVRIFDFNLDFQPLGPDYPYLRLPLHEETLVIIAPELVADENGAGAGLLGRYGLGYALLKDPTTGVLAYGPGQFDAGFQLIDFKLTADGRISACLVFTVNRPERLLNLSLNPLSWGLELANLMSLGMASRFLAPLKEAVSRVTPQAGPDPIFTFIAFANAISGGRAAQDLCISRERLEKDMLLQHFMQHYTLITGALTTWRRVADWTEAASVPDWVWRGGV